MLVEGRKCRAVGGRKRSSVRGKEFFSAARAGVLAVHGETRWGRVDSSQNITIWKTNRKNDKVIGTCMCGSNRCYWYLLAGLDPITAAFLVPTFPPFHPARNHLAHDILSDFGPDAAFTLRASPDVTDLQHAGVGGVFEDGF